MKKEVNILIAEDDMGHAALIRKNLVRSGITNSIIHFKDGQEILDFLFKTGGKPHRESGISYLLLLDIRMPKVDGVEVLRRLKEDKELKKIKMMHSKSGFATIYYTPEGKFAVVLSRNDELLLRKVYSKDDINQDKVVELISESGIDFLSFSAIYDSAEQIESLILNPEKFESEDTVSIPPWYLS